MHSREVLTITGYILSNGCSPDDEVIRQVICSVHEAFKP